MMVFYDKICINLLWDVYYIYYVGELNLINYIYMNILYSKHSMYGKETPIIHTYVRKRMF